MGTFSFFILSKSHRTFSVTRRFYLETTRHRAPRIICLQIKFLHLVEEIPLHVGTWSVNWHPRLQDPNEEFIIKSALQIAEIAYWKCQYTGRVHLHTCITVDSLEKSEEGYFAKFIFQKARSMGEFAKPQVTK